MASEESIMNCEDLEDGEIESDDECEIVVSEKPQNETIKKPEKSPTPPPSRKSNDTKKTSSRKERSNQEEDDFMCSIESKIANVLKEKGLEPPMPNIRKLDPEPEQQQQKSSRSSRKRRKRKERKDQKRDNASSKKRSKLSDSDNLYMVGGSPDNSGSDSDHSYTSYSSYDSDDYHRSAYEDRRNKRREKYGSRNDRDRDRKERRNRDAEKEVCLRFAEYGHCPDDDCQRLHEVRQPKKMELCKFWLMECCAKKEKCSYMHGDFPCKYYYLGLKCINKDCKFMHGKPLSDNLKQILLKHLDTAPKEILGDFPRIGRENATKMISQTHVKLCQEYNIPLPENEKASSKIPALLEMKLNPPEEFSSKSENRKESSRSSRWQQQKDQQGKSTSQQSRSSSSTKATALSEPGDMLLSEMRGILSDKQIETMASIGVRIVNHINNLTVSQINDIGLSLATIGEIQATAINMHNKAKKTSEETDDHSPTQENNAEKEETSADVDMRVFNMNNINDVATPLKSPDTIMSPNQSDMEGQDNKPSTSTQSIIMSPPQSSTIDYSQYLRDSNLNSNDEENEDEPGGLKIDYASDCETEEKKDSQSEDDQSEIKLNMPSANVPLLPPSFDTNAFLNSSSVLSKVDISSSIQQLMEKAAPAEKVSHRDPRVRGSTQKPSETIVELSSPTYKEGSSSSSIQKLEQLRRTSIYEIESPSEDEDINIIKLGKDKDMRVPPFLRDSENGDVDFRFPFAPMTNYIPATEIEASFGTHVFNKYEVKIVEIPKPDYSEIKRSFQKMESIQDPRLKKLCNLGESNQSNSSSNLDPRKRKLNDSGTTDSVHSNNSNASNAGTKRLQISTILQNSKHYNELSSSQKMIVNDILAELSKQLKVFHSDKSSSKIFDTTFITQNPRLGQILIGLGVFVNAEGEFEEIKEMPIATTPQVLPNIHQMPPMIPNIMQQPPPNLMHQPPNFIGPSASLRPGLLGIAPPNLQPFNFDPQDFTTMNNQNPNFGNEQNFNRNQRSGSNSSNNFRNNSHHRNSNYRSNRR
ncbi:protein suppressor of sable [Chironomus tepperi]|uniref:protein suppressor of sable n=1 Tax=Chironomus tepperi TaxID=113505 RepID=UPI00391F25A9